MIKSIKSMGVSKIGTLFIFNFKIREKQRKQMKIKEKLFEI